MGPDKGQRNDPSTVVRGVAAIAEVKGVSVQEAKQAIRDNFRTLFGI
jgi:Tat protein secretion system quality control protein TatD with DNase activity